MFFLHRWAQRLLPLRLPGFAVAVGGILLLVAMMMGQRDPHDASLRLALIATLWALLLTAFLHLFRRPPPVVLPLLPLHEQLTTRMLRWLYRIVAAGFLALVVSVCGLTLKLLLLH